MKKILLTLTGIVLSCCAMAQIAFADATSSPLARNPQASAVAPRQAPKRIQLADNQVIMGAYTSDDYISSLSKSSGLPRYPGTLLIGQVIPAEALATFDGCKIVKMRVAFALAPGQSQFFIAPLSSDGQVQDNVFQKVVASTKAGWNLVTLDTPYEIDAKAVGGLLLGFSYKQVDTNDGQYYDDMCYPLSIMDGGENYPLMVSGIQGSSEWYSMGEGALSVQAIVEGNFPSLAAQPADFGSVLVPFGKSVTKAIKIRNMGKSAIQKLTYTITVDGQTGSEKTVQLSSPLNDFNSTGEFDVTFTSSATECTDRRVITITKVNGQANEAAVQASSGLVASTSTTLDRRAVVEEYTGTGCGWCPRGIVGMENLRAKFGDRFIGIALHQYNGSDAMYLSEENYAPLGLSSAPSCMVDRSGTVDPYYDTADAVEYELTVPAKVDVNVAAAWASDGRSVDATANVTSLIDGASFGIEFVLVADGLSGTTSSWAQTNYYSSEYASATRLTKNSIESDLRFLWDEGATFYPTFNDVAVASSYSAGVNQAAPLENLKPDAPVSNTFKLNVPNKLLSAVKKGKAYVVALVIDDDGTINNAAKCEVNAYGTGINSVEGAATQVAGKVYSVDGRTLNKPQQGINIVRMADGSVRKVLIH